MKKASVEFVAALVAGLSLPATAIAEDELIYLKCEITDDPRKGDYLQLQLNTLTQKVEGQMHSEASKFSPTFASGTEFQVKTSASSYKIFFVTDLSNKHCNRPFEITIEIDRSNGYFRHYRFEPGCDGQDWFGMYGVGWCKKDLPWPKPKF